MSSITQLIIINYAEIYYAASLVSSIVYAFHKSSMKGITIKPPPRILVAILVLALSALSLPVAGGQVRSKPMPDTAFFPLVFRHILHTQNLPGQLIGPDGIADATRFTYIEKAGLNPAETTAFAQVALDYQRAVAPLDAQAKSIIRGIRLKYPGGRIPEGQSPPTVPAEIYELKAQHDRLVIKHIAMLQARGSAEIPSHQRLSSIHHDPSISRNDRTP